MTDVDVTSDPAREGEEKSDITFLALNGAKLLGSGLISALALSVVTSNRWGLLDPSVGVALVLFLQWQILGLTITKMGLDQIIFAAVTENPFRQPTTSLHMRSRALPLGIAFSALVTVVFGPWYGVACFLSLLLDTHSILMVADLNARERYTEVMLASFLNYPLFFALAFGLQVWHPLTIEMTLLLFVFTSFIRWAWLRSKRLSHATLPTYDCKGTPLTAAAPLLNYLMFRGDQVLLGTTVAATFVASVGNDFVRQILFMGRYQELLAGGVAMLTGIVFPRLHLRYPFANRDLLMTVARRWWLVAALILGVALSLAAYTLLWRGAPIPHILLASSALSALLVLPANLVTYSMIRQGHLYGLVRNLAMAGALGLCAFVACYRLSVPLIFVGVVPLQLSTFVLLVLSTDWLSPAPL